MLNASSGESKLPPVTQPEANLSVKRDGGIINQTHMQRTGSRGSGTRMMVGDGEGEVRG